MTAKDAQNKIAAEDKPQDKPLSEDELASVAAADGNNNNPPPPDSDLWRGGNFDTDARPVLG